MLCVYIPGLAIYSGGCEGGGRAYTKQEYTVRLEVDEASPLLFTTIFGQEVVFFRGCALETLPLVEDSVYIHKKGNTAAANYECCAITTLIEQSSTINCTNSKPIFIDFMLHH